MRDENCIDGNKWAKRILYNKISVMANVLIDFTICVLCLKISRKLQDLFRSAYTIFIVILLFYIYVYVSFCNYLLNN